MAVVASEVVVVVLAEAAVVVVVAAVVSAVAVVATSALSTAPSPPAPRSHSTKRAFDLYRGMWACSCSVWVWLFDTVGFWDAPW